MLLQIHGQEDGPVEFMPADMKADPFTGGPLIVKKQKDGWLVYSVGMNLQDDGGDLSNVDDLRKSPDIGFGPPPAP
jgi:hypothetical protein